MNIQVAPDYVISVEDCPVRTLVFGATIDSPLFHLIHPNIVAAVPKVLDFKHYRAGGSKFWTSKAGRDFYAVFESAAIEFLLEKTYSYPKVKINGQTFSLNTSGGTSGALWVDNVRAITWACCNLPIRVMRKILDKAMPVEKARAVLSLPVKEMKPERIAEWRKMVAKHFARHQLKPNQKLYLVPGCDYEYVIYEEKAKRKNSRLICFETSSGTHRTVAIDAIDWVKSAEVNGILTPEPNCFNKIGDIQPENS